MKTQVTLTRQEFMISLQSDCLKQTKDRYVPHLVDPFGDFEKQWALFKTIDKATTQTMIIGFKQ